MRHFYQVKYVRDGANICDYAAHASSFDLVTKRSHSAPVCFTMYVFPRSGRAAMYVANHSSWLDIPFLGGTIGWRNYKIVAKKELLKVPILGPAIKVGGNVIVDRSDRKSQLRTLKNGIDWLKVRS